MWKLVDPSTGSHTINVTLTGSEQLVGGAVSYRGVGSVGSFVANNGATLTGLLNQPTVSGLPTTSGVVLVDTVAIRSGDTLTEGASQTVRWDDQVGSNVSGAGSTARASQRPGTMGWQVGNLLTLSVNWTIGAVPLFPSC
jgi:hypothetical protein